MTRKSGKHREALTTEIAAKVGRVRAEAVVATMAERTRTGIIVLAITVGGVLLARNLDAPWYVTLGIGIGGAAWAGSAWSGQYFVRSLRDFVQPVVDLYKQIKG